MTVFFGFGLADSMFPDFCSLERSNLTVEQLRHYIATSNVKMCVNPSHSLTLEVLATRYGVTVTVPEQAPLVKLVAGDTLLLMAVSGLPRLEGRHEYTAPEIEACVFRFARWDVS